MFAGTSDARVLRVSEAGGVEPVPSFDTVAGASVVALGRHPAASALDDGDRRRWRAARQRPRGRHPAFGRRGHAVGAPRSRSTTTCTRCVAHPSRPEIVVAAASVGLCRSTDGGATWESTTDGMEMSYARGVAVVGDDVVVTVSDGPWSERSALYRASVDGGPVAKVTGGLPEYLSGNIDTRCVASDGTNVALVDGGGDVWHSTEGCDGFEHIAGGLTGATGIAIP